MTEFFHGWRRKAGCVTLLVATLSMVAWVRRVVTRDIIWWQSNNFPAVMFDSAQCVLHVSLESDLPWKSYIPLMVSWSSSPASEAKMVDPDKESWIFHFLGCSLNAINKNYFLLVVRYWVIAIPSTAISAYLILWNPRKKPTANSSTQVS